MGTVENLIAARALIDTPEKWIKDELWNDDKTCFCAMGAVAMAARARDGMISDTLEYKALQEVAPAMGVPNFNDEPSTTHADIMALFDRAIAAEKAKEASNA